MAMYKVAPGDEYYTAAIASANLVNGEWVTDNSFPPSHFLTPIIESGERLDKSLKVFVRKGSVFVPDAAPELHDARIACVNVRKNAECLKARIAKTYRFAGRRHRRDKPELLPVHEVHIGNVGDAQNIAAHAIYDCAGILMDRAVRDSDGLPADAIDRFRRNLEILRDGLETPPAPTSSPPPIQLVAVDPVIEARDKWLYDECCKLTAYETILRRQDQRPQSWPRLESINGIKNAASGYANRHNLTPIPKRQRGRPLAK